MFVFLTAFSLFNLFAGTASLAKAMRLVAPRGRARWASRRLYAIAVALAFSFPLVCLVATGAAWSLVNGGADRAAPLVLTPIAWLIAFGILFTVVDVAEDGVLGNGLKPRSGVKTP
jgi:hypothetical protein